jgi:hypothetical protein
MNGQSRVMGIRQDRGSLPHIDREVDSQPVARIAIDLDVASANGFDLPVTDSRSGIDETSLRRRNRRYSLAPKHITAAKKIALLACGPGKPGPYGALSSLGRKLSKRHTLAQHSPEAYASSAANASSANPPVVPSGKVRPLIYRSPLHPSHELSVYHESVVDVIY